MESSDYKHYHEKEFDHKEFADSFFCDSNFEHVHESVEYPMKMLHDVFSSGLVQGNTLMDVTSGSAVYQLLSAAKTFKEIYVSEFTDGAIKEFHKWLNKEHGAHDWSYPAKFLAELEDKGDTWEENEDNVRRAIKKVVKWDICGGPLQPHEVPQVDCVISFWVLQKISKTKEEFKNNLKNVVSQIKKGGWLIIFTALNMSYYRFGKNMDKHFFLAIDGNFLRAAVIDAGLVIAKFEILPRSKVSDVLDHDSVAFLLANKKLGG